MMPFHSLSQSQSWQPPAQQPADPLKVGCDAIVDLLTSRQHLHPRESVRETMELATRQLGCCPAAIARAVEWLHTDVDRAVGRLRRSELLQLARAVYRFWRHTTAPSGRPDAGASGAEFNGSPASLSASDVADRATDVRR